MYYYEKDYIMRLIHGIALVLARLLLGRQMENEGEIATILDKQEKEQNDLLLRMVDEGKINRAEERLFDLLENASWDDRHKAAVAICFYSHVNDKDDEFLEKADFTREEPEQTLPYRAAAFHFDRSGWYDPACCPHCDKALPERCLEGGLFGKYPRSVFARCPHCIPDISDRTVRNRRWQKNTDLTCMKYVPY